MVIFKEPQADFINPQKKINKDLHRNREELKNSNVDPEVYERIVRHVETGNLAEKFKKVQSLYDLQRGVISEEEAERRGVDLSLKDKPDIAKDDLLTYLYQPENKNSLNTVLSFLEHRGKAQLLNQVKEGDVLLSFIAPSGSTFSIKVLNDKYLGQQLTDSVIVKRKELLQELFGEKLDVLEQEFKQSFFRVRKGVDSKSEDFKQWLDKQSRELETRMNEFILNNIVKPELEKNNNGQANDNLFLLKEKLENSLSQLAKGENLSQDNSYKVTYGQATVEKSKNKLDQPAILAEIKALQMAQLSRDKKDVYGFEFNEQQVKEQLKKINNLINELIEGGNVIEDANGFMYSLFTEMEYEDEQGEKQVYYKLNKDLWRFLRKGNFNLDSEDKENQKVFEKLKRYKTLINFLDYFKPYLAEELATGEIENKLKKQQIIANKLRHQEEIDNDEFAMIYNLLNKDLKDKRFSSVNVFHQKALQIENCSYVSLDVLGLGSDLLANYEKTCQQLDPENTEDWSNKFMKIGDEITKKMRNIRGVALDILAEYNIDNPLSKVGGDELVFAIDNAKVSDEMLVKLKSKTSSRVVKTVVAEVERSKVKKSKDENPVVETLISHIASLKRSEHAIDKTKMLEAQVQLLIDKMKSNVIRNVIDIETGKNQVPINLEFANYLNISEKELEDFFNTNDFPIPYYRNSFLKEKEIGDENGDEDYYVLSKSSSNSNGEFIKYNYEEVLKKIKDLAKQI